MSETDEIIELERNELRRLILEIIRECFGDAPPSPLTVDVVNLDRNGKSGLVYLDGAIVRRGTQLLDGYHRIRAANFAGATNATVQIAQIDEDEDDPIPGAIYVPAGPTPEYVVDRPSRTILIGWSRAEGLVTRDQMRTATMAALADLFGN
jgi:hypothetical protein